MKLRQWSFRMLASWELSVAAATVLLLGLPSVLTAQNSDASSIDGRAAASDEESPEDALQADQREALSMLEKKQYRLLLHDLFPGYLIYQREPVFSGREQNLLNGPLLSDEEALDLTAHCKAALTGTKVFNRNKSVVKITYTYVPHISKSISGNLIRGCGRFSGAVFFGRDA